MDRSQIEAYAEEIIRLTDTASIAAQLTERDAEFTVTDDVLTVDLADGRTISVPLSWFPRLTNGTSEERTHWRLVGQGEGIHWPDLDEDISVRSLLAGRASDETQESLRKWLAGRQSRPA